MDTLETVSRQEIDKQAAINAVLAEDVYQYSKTYHRYIENRY